MIETMKTTTFRPPSDPVRNGTVPHHFTIDEVLRNGRAAIPAATGGAVVVGAVGSILLPGIGAPIGVLVGAGLGGLLGIYSRNKRGV